MADDGPTLNAGLVAAIFQGIRTCFARKPYIFVIFQGGPNPLSPFPLDPHMDSNQLLIAPVALFTLFTEFLLKCAICLLLYHLDLVVRKPVFGVFDQARHKPACSASETS